MKNKSMIASLVIAAALSGCAGGQSGSSSGLTNALPMPTQLSPIANGVVHGQIIMDVQSTQGAATSSADVMKRAKEYAMRLLNPTSFASYTDPNCTHGSCTDWVDITVVNAPQTQFALDATALSAGQMDQTNNNYSVSNAPLNIGALKISTLYDNNLMACGTAGSPAKCDTASIVIYTDNTGLVTGSTAPLYGLALGGASAAGLWNIADFDGTDAISVPLMVVGASDSQAPTAMAVPDDSASQGTIVEQIAIPSGTQVIDQSFFPQGGEPASNGLGGTVTSAAATPGYPLTADFTTAASGTYTARVVLEYVLSSQAAGTVAGGTVAGQPSNSP